MVVTVWEATTRLSQMYADATCPACQYHYLQTGSARTLKEFALLICEEIRVVRLRGVLLNQAPAGTKAVLGVTHGIFSKGAITKLREAGYETIYTTDSYVPDALTEPARKTFCVVDSVWRS